LSEYLAGKREIFTRADSANVIEESLHLALIIYRLEPIRDHHRATKRAVNLQFFILYFPDRLMRQKQAKNFLFPFRVFPLFASDLNI
jgi:dolichol kinase